MTKVKSLVSKTTRYTERDIENPMDDLTREDFDFLSNLGKGAYGTVFKVQHKKTKQNFALKEVSKEMVLKYDKIKAVFRESEIHENMSECEYIINLECTF